MMPGGRFDGDWIVGLIGVLMALFLVSRSSRLRELPGSRRLLLGAVWAVIFGVVAGIAALLSRGSS